MGVQARVVVYIGEMSPIPLSDILRSKGSAGTKSFKRHAHVNLSVDM